MTSCSGIETSLSKLEAPKTGLYDSECHSKIGGRPDVAKRSEKKVLMQFV